MKKSYQTFIDLSASNIENIIVSAGKIGIQMELAVDDLVRAIDGTIDDLI